jgi:hypothetical protein
MTEMILLMLSTFVLVFLRAFQTQNVIHRHYYFAGATSFLMAGAEVAVVLGVVSTGWAAVPWIGTGGALGVTASMFLHKKYLQVENWNQK